MSLYKLKTSLSELKGSNTRSSQVGYQKVAPQRAVGGNQFGTGEVRFDIDIPSGRWVTMPRSFIKLEVALTTTDGKALLVADKIAPAFNICSTLFQSCEIQMNGFTISKCANNVAEVSTMKTRLNKSKAWMDSIGKSSQLMEESWTVRRNGVIYNAMRFTDAPVVADYKYATNGQATVSSFGLTQHDSKTNTFQVLWQPPLSLWDCENAIPSCKLTVILNPHPTSTFQLRGIETAHDKEGKSSTHKLEVQAIDAYFHTSSHGWLILFSL